MPLLNLASIAWFSFTKLRRFQAESGVSEEIRLVGRTMKHMERGKKGGTSAFPLRGCKRVYPLAAPQRERGCSPLLSAFHMLHCSPYKANFLRNAAFCLKAAQFCKRKPRDRREVQKRHCRSLKICCPIGGKSGVRPCAPPVTIRAMPENEIPLVRRVSIGIL